MTLRMTLPFQKLEYQGVSKSGEVEWIPLTRPTLYCMDFHSFVDYVKSVPTVYRYDDDGRNRVYYTEFLDKFCIYAKPTLVYRLSAHMSDEFRFDIETWTFTIPIKKTSICHTLFYALKEDMRKIKYIALTDNVDDIITSALIYTNIKPAHRVEILEFIYDEGVKCRVSVYNNTMVF
jgi:hypothetical protein